MRILQWMCGNSKSYDQKLGYKGQGRQFDGRQDAKSEIKMT